MEVQRTGQQTNVDRLALAAQNQQPGADAEPQDIHAKRLEAVNDLQQAKAEHQSIKSVLFLIASDEVLKRMTDFHNYMAENPTVTPEDLPTRTELYAAMIIAMREDSYEETGLNVDEINLRLAFT